MEIAYSTTSFHAFSTKLAQSSIWEICFLFLQVWMLARLCQLENKIFAVGEPSYRWNPPNITSIPCLICMYYFQTLDWLLVEVSTDGSSLSESNLWYFSARRSRVKRVRESVENSLRGRIELIESYARVCLLYDRHNNPTPTLPMKYLRYLFSKA